LIAFRAARTSSPSTRHGPRQRSCGFLPASSPVAGSPCGSPDADDAGCVRPTSASHHSVNEHPRLVGSRSTAIGLTRFRRSKRGILHGTPLASVDRVPSFDARRFLPRAEALDRTSDTPVASEHSRGATPYFFGATTPLSKRLARFVRHPHDGTTKPSNRGAFHRQVPEPSTRAPAVECRPRVMTRVRSGLAALHTATRLSKPLRSRRPPLLACAIGEGPPLARPRPRELVVRLEEDLAHASLGQASPADFCNTTRRTGTPFERPILARELRRPKPLSTSARAEAPNPRSSPSFSAFADGHTRFRAYRSIGEDEPCEPLSKAFAFARTSTGRGHPSEGLSLLRASSPPRTFPRAPGSPHRRFGRAGDSPSLRGHGQDPLPPPPREERRFPKDRGALRRFGTHRTAVFAAARLLGARREIAPAHDAPDRPSVTPPLTFP